MITDSKYSEKLFEFGKQLENLVRETTVGVPDDILTRYLKSWVHRYASIVDTLGTRR